MYIEVLVAELCTGFIRYSVQFGVKFLRYSLRLYYLCATVNLNFQLERASTNVAVDSINRIV